MSKIINEALLLFTANMPCRQIVIDGELYLRRYFVGIDETGRQTWLHEILLPDTGRALHSHPWWAQAKILSGGYTEERLHPEGKRDFNNLRVGEFNIIEPTTLHRIVEIRKHTWTELSIAPGREPHWFFINYDGTKEAVATNDEHWYKNAPKRNVGL